MVPPMILLLAKSDLVREFDLSSLTFIQTGVSLFYSSNGIVLEIFNF